MASYQELFAIGEGFDAFVARGLPAEIAAVRAVQQRLEEPGLISAATRERLAAVQGRYHLLVAGEMWCPDCQLNITALDWLCRQQPRIDLAVISKGRAENELQQRLGLERVAIPLVAVLDAGFEVVGRFIERPQVVVAGWDGVKPAYRAGDYLEGTVLDLVAVFEGAEGRVFAGG